MSKKLQPIPAASAIEEHALAPYTAAQVGRIRAWQEHAGTESIGCPNNPHRSRGSELGTIALVVSEHGLVCTICGYRQTVVPLAVADGTALKAVAA